MTTKLYDRDAEKFWPETYTVDCVGKKSVTSDLADEASEGGSDTSSVQKLAKSLSASVRAKRDSGTNKLLWAASGQGQNAMGNRLPWLQRKETGRISEKPKGKGKGGGERPMEGEEASRATCAEELDTPARLCPSEGRVNNLNEENA